MSECVLIGGVFDPLHAGHLAYLHEARKYGAYVVCALSDAPEKHPSLVPIQQRAELLRHLGVNRIVIHTGNLCDVLRQIRPRVYIKGNDWAGQLPADQVETCQELGIRIDYLDTVTESSSKLLADYQRALNAEKLAAFEAFVQSQKPADKPWTPVTDYSRETRRAIEAPQADIIAEVFKGCTVLDYGCGFGYLVELLKERGMVARGWEPYQAPTFALSRDEGKPYGLVICREVLEHLTASQIAATARTLIALSSRYVYVTTRFTAAPHLLGVDGADDLDPTHITLLNQDFLRTLFVLEGCTRCPDLEEKLDHQQKGRVLVYRVPA